MKTNNYGFSYREIYVAYEACLKNKRNTNNALKYTMNMMHDLPKLCNEINNRTYKIGSSIAFVVTKPVYREVFAANFRDRIVHHLIMGELMPYFEKEFIPESFSCREGKGNLNGVKTMYNYISDCTKGYTEDAYVLKLDIKSFFMSIDKRKLADMVVGFIERVYPNNRKKEKLKWLCEMVIMHHPELDCEKRGLLSLWDKLEKSKSLFSIEGEKGLPIGNLTSQVFANFYLNGLDKFIKESLGFKHYGRYVDDFVIVCESKERLLWAVPLIDAYLRNELGLMLHPNKRYLQHYKNGVKFIGGVLKKGRKYISNRTKGNLYYKLMTEFSTPSKEKAEKLVAVINSYLGFMVHYNSYKIRKEILLKSGLLDKWLDYVEISKDFKKIKLKECAKPKHENPFKKIGEREICIE